MLRKKAEIMRKPEWLKLKIQGDKNTTDVESMIEGLNLHTVCHEANCPNKMECYSRRTATFMILGRNCTRNCTFCNVTRHAPDPVDLNEPENLAKAVQILGLKHAVVTSVTRDDLPDEGANQFAEVVRQCRKYNPETTIELLIPDMSGRKELMDIIYETKPDVLNHNVETIPAFYPKVRPAANFQRSLEVLRYAKECGLKTKSGLMVGFGETEEQVVEVFKALRDVGCDMVTVGQYLQPTKFHIAVKEYVHPQQFDRYRDIAFDMGFLRVNSGPLVRSSYHAESL
ncbi:lipoyl synthase [Parvimonas micra]|uniref:lipoyl synthase n=1 Tax=Parvimonas TaxID=543311 RepID=UPI00020DDDAA|nr:MULTISPECIES: lipoyl synthase [unclassified Parvimonas]EGL35727.1 lipoyl synthase [Parvimonas sp. oral taxon 110 str. F0139]MBF1300221.1 lipoyl synthase [Parvimonas sp.]MEB3012312.1 lipoyl synthase [Parvimonas sp. D2]MEB3087743.1 lipoyl synthase [Parvimonas sp. D4]